MPNPADVARERIFVIKAELAELEQFLAIYYRLSDSETPSIALSAQLLEVPKPAESKGNVAPQNGTTKSVDKPRVKRSGIRPGDVAEHMARIIREVGLPMTRGDLVEALERRDIHIPYEDKGRYIGTIAWRHKGTFESIEGKGYWLRGEQMPKSLEDRHHNPFDELEQQMENLLGRKLN